MLAAVETRGPDSWSHTCIATDACRTPDMVARRCTGSISVALGIPNTSSTRNNEILAQSRYCMPGAVATTFETTRVESCADMMAGSVRLPKSI